MNKKIIFSMILLIIVSALYRVIPNRPMGFAPQIAMALFSGCIFVNNKKWAFMLPLLSMFISDIIFQILYINHMSTINGFYPGQWINYILFSILTCFGFLINTKKSSSIISFTLLTPTFYFLISNAIVWISGGGYHRSTLLQCYVDGLPFYINSIFATIFYGFLLLGIFQYVTKIQNAYKYEQPR